MTREEISKIPAADLIGRRIVFLGIGKTLLCNRVIMNTRKDRLTVKDENNTLENIPWTCVQSIE